MCDGCGAAWLLHIFRIWMRGIRLLIKKLFDDNFDFAFKAATYNNMRVAIQTFEQFKKKNEDFFSFDKRETLFGHLRTYAIEKQL